ncbi:MAG: hypothetical protein E7647_03665 [Ruminococcaceae bacterium]|nr:hypothetical protein [Oscillospiraceae bacterium]
MKRILALTLAVIFLLLGFASCSDKEKTVKAAYNEENQLVADNGVVYNYAPGGYQPTNQAGEYGVIDNVMQEKLYRIGELDPEKWITTEYSGFATTVYYAADIGLPTLKEMDPKLCYICEEDEAVISQYTLGGGDLSDVDKERELICEVIDLISDESIEAEMWPRVFADESYVLKFYSEDWPAIYYCLEYVREGGNGYVYDYISKKCINIGDRLEGYFGNAQ